MPSTSSYNFAYLYKLGQRCENQACHESVKTGIVSLTAILFVNTENRVVVFAICLEAQIVVVFFILRALLVKILEIRFGEASSVQREGLGIVQVWQKLSIDTVCELSVGLRQWPEKLMVHESYVIDHIVSDNWFLRLADLFHHAAEA